MSTNIYFSLLDAVKSLIITLSRGSSRLSRLTAVFRFLTHREQMNCLSGLVKLTEDDSVESAEEQEQDHHILDTVRNEEFISVRLRWTRSKNFKLQVGFIQGRICGVNALPLSRIHSPRQPKGPPLVIFLLILWERARRKVTIFYSIFQ